MFILTAMGFMKENLLAQAPKDNPLKKMVIDYDEFSDRTTYQDSTSPSTVDDNGIYLSIFAHDHKKKPAFISLKIRYYADKWLFIQSYSFSIDGERYSFTPIKVFRDNDEQIWERSADVLDANIYKIVKAIIKSKTAKIRFNGTESIDDREITDEEKQAMKNVLDAYKELGGDFSFIAK
jgi:hypothetical protein